jgi:hypothetical protein
VSKPKKNGWWPCITRFGEKECTWEARLPQLALLGPVGDSATLARWPCDTANRMSWEDDAGLVSRPKKRRVSKRLRYDVKTPLSAPLRLHQRSQSKGEFLRWWAWPCHDHMLQARKMCSVMTAGESGQAIGGGHSVMSLRGRRDLEIFSSNPKSTVGVFPSAANCATQSEIIALLVQRCAHPRRS